MIASSFQSLESPRSPVTVPPRLEPSCFINSASDERSIVIRRAFRGGVEAALGAEREALIGAGNGHLERQRKLRRVGRRARARDLGQARELGDRGLRATAARRHEAERDGEGRKRERERPQGHTTVTIDADAVPVIHQTGYQQTAAPLPTPGASRRPRRRRCGRGGKAWHAVPARGELRETCRPTASSTYRIGRAWLTTSSVSSGRASSADRASAKRRAAAVLLSPPPGQGASGSCSHAQPAVRRERPSVEGAETDLVEKRFDDPRDGATRERELERLLGTQES